MDWFETLMSFRETSWDGTRSKLALEGRRLKSVVNGKSYSVGQLELASLHELRQRLKAAEAPRGRLQARIVNGDVKALHRFSENEGALFQVASQFNLLEMVGPDVTPEDGVGRYEGDLTQGPACAIAAGAATIYRNYFAPAAGAEGQTAERQIDALAPLGHALAAALNWSIDELWTMQNGYALCTPAGLGAITELLRRSPPDEVDALRGELRIGLHWDVEVTDAPGPDRPLVSQAFCSALPVSYTSVPRPHWEAFASLVLDAAYEATMAAGALNARRGASNVILLTSLGGGVFGNDDRWIHAAMRRALNLVSEFALDVKIVSYRTPSPGLLEVVEEFA